MTTLLSVHSKQRCISTCDARCYNGMQPSELKEPRRDACICICGGANHGVGLNHAVYNVNTRGVGLRRADLEAYAFAHGHDPDELVVVDGLRSKTAYMARKRALQRLEPAPLVPGEDLFACEEVST
jgi:hypothetical protein